MNMTKNFKKSEFLCPCCGKDNISVYLVKLLQKMRDLCGFPLVITSGCRCEKQNKLVKGIKKSAHLSGNAVDIKALTNRTRYWIIHSALLVGFTRIGIYKYHIHLDRDLDKPQRVIWYNGKDK